MPGLAQSCFRAARCRCRLFTALARRWSGLCSVCGICYFTFYYQKNNKISVMLNVFQHLCFRLPPSASASIPASTSALMLLFYHLSFNFIFLYRTGRYVGDIPVIQVSCPNVCIGHPGRGRQWCCCFYPARPHDPAVRKQQVSGLCLNNSAIQGGVSESIK